MFLYVHTIDIQSAIEDAQSKCLVQFSTPDEASVEFGILLDEIVQELEKDESNNLRQVKNCVFYINNPESLKSLCIH